MNKRKREKPQDSEMQFDKVPPQAIELEEAVLGAMLQDKECLSVAFELLSGEYFYKESHSIIFNAMVDLYKASEPIDILTLVHALRKDGNLESVGGALAVSKLTNNVASSAHIDAHAKIIIQHFIKRELIKVGGEIVNEGYSDASDPFDLINYSARKIEGIEQRTIKGSYQTPMRMLKEMLSDLESRMKGVEIKRKVNSCIQSIQYRTSGFFGGEFIVVAGRPGMGKTAYMLSEIYAMANAGYPVAVFSLEMSALQLMQRIASMITGINSEVMTKGKPTIEEFEMFNKCLGRIESLPIYIDDTANKNIYDIRVETKALVKKHKVKMIFIDYLQLCTAFTEGKGKSSNREAEVSVISRTCKLIAKENDIPVMALSQLSRDVEKREKTFGRPKLSDLRESGAIEQDADMVGFVYREAVYNKKAEEGEALFIIEKNRSGKLGDCRMLWVSDKTQFISAPYETKLNFYEAKRDFDQSEETDDMPF